LETVGTSRSRDITLGVIWDAMEITTCPNACTFLPSENFETTEENEIHLVYSQRLVFEFNDEDDAEYKPNFAPKTCNSTAPV
jgi:hypothetical protein